MKRTLSVLGLPNMRKEEVNHQIALACNWTYSLSLCHMGAIFISRLYSWQALWIGNKIVDAIEWILLISGFKNSMDWCVLDRFSCVIIDFYRINRNTNIVCYDVLSLVLRKIKDTVEATGKKWFSLFYTHISILL